MDLDRFLVQFWESRDIRPKVMYPVVKGREVVCVWAGVFLPEITERRIIELHGFQ